MTPHSPTLPKVLLLLKEHLFGPLGLSLTHFLAEPESSEYTAHTFQLNDKAILYREAHITPTKTGQFVTLWKRSLQGPIEPYSISDPLNLVFISTRRGEEDGLFIFSKDILLKMGILSHENKEGKRAFRVYPPWDLAINNQAKKTQQWQVGYFLNLHQEKPMDLERAKRLLGI